MKALTVHFEALANERLVPGIIVAVQTFGERINFHPHLHLLVTEGGMDRGWLEGEIVTKRTAPIGRAGPRDASPR